VQVTYLQLRNILCKRGTTSTSPIVHTDTWRAKSKLHSLLHSTVVIYFPTSPTTTMFNHTNSFNWIKLRYLKYGRDKHCNNRVRCAPINPMIMANKSQGWGLRPHHGAATGKESAEQNHNNSETYAWWLWHRVHLTMGWSRLLAVGDKTASAVMTSRD